MRFLETGDMRGINAQHAAWLRVLLTTLDASAKPADMNLPGFRLHQLSGDRRGNGPFRYQGIGGWCSNSRAVKPPMSIWSTIIEDRQGQH
jgi:hypothetical protein